MPDCDDMHGDKARRWSNHPTDDCGPRGLHSKGDDQLLPCWEVMEGLWIWRIAAGGLVMYDETVLWNKLRIMRAG